MTLVYKHIRKDDNTIFYIGIGNEDRPHDTANRNPIWKYIVNETKYDVEVIAEGITRDEAYTTEMELIKLHGRIDNGTGILANRTDGGKDEWKGPGELTPLPVMYNKFKSHKSKELKPYQLHLLKRRIALYRKTGDDRLEYELTRLNTHYKTAVERIRRLHISLDKIELTEDKRELQHKKYQARKLIKKVQPKNKVQRIKKVQPKNRSYQDNTLSPKMLVKVKAHKARMLAKFPPNDRP